jgi:hypothetical protein
MGVFIVIGLLIAAALMTVFVLVDIVLELSILSNQTPPDLECDYYCYAELYELAGPLRQWYLRQWFG